MTSIHQALEYLRDNRVYPHLIAVTLLIWGRFPEPPKVLRRFTNCTIGKWVSLYAVTFATVANANHTVNLALVSLLAGLRYGLDSYSESENYYYNEMYRESEPEVENRPLFI